MNSGQEPLPGGSFPFLYAWATGRVNLSGLERVVIQ